MKANPPLFLLTREGNEPGIYCIRALVKKEWMGEVQSLFFDSESGNIDFIPPGTLFLPYLRENLSRLRKVISTTSRNPETSGIEIPFTIHEKEVDLVIPRDAASIYADGSCMHGDHGGWAAVIRYGPGLTVLTGREKESSNNRMELTAVIKAAERIHQSVPVVIYSDSRYVIQGTSHWLENWVHNDFMTAQNRSAKNRDLWERMAQLKKERKLFFLQISSSQMVYWHKKCHNLSRLAASSHV